VAVKNQLIVGKTIPVSSVKILHGGSYSARLHGHSVDYYFNFLY
jgi:hypothetical protein